MSKADAKAISRQKAEALLSRGKQQDAARLSALDEERRLQDAKIARLRKARLAKEAAEEPGADEEKRGGASRTGRPA